MNLVSAFVTEVIKEPVYTRYGWEDTTEIYFKTKEEALAIKAGYEFLT